MNFFHFKSRGLYSVEKSMNGVKRTLAIHLEAAELQK